ncbi:MAG: apolipoprotein N-acyltransferase [Pusillimonas sp.]|nr:apolipoprotein N-acyltransferase [Pusillimonas sp.]|tara:strand:+ start:51729 stop:53363 length:1635 start_codon:yes stop_codon:yes gene_type:complete
MTTTESRLHRVREAVQPLLLGAAHAFTFSNGPLPGWLLPYAQILILVFLARHIWQCRRTARAAQAGFLFGFGHFALGLYWLYISLHHFGGLAPALSVAAVLALAGAMALYPALATGLAYFLTRGLRQPGGHFFGLALSAAIWASCWALTEWLRGTLFTGFPWLNIGYAHAGGLLTGWAPIFGVYGVAWLAAFCAAAVALLIQAHKTTEDSRAAAAVALAIVLSVAGFGLSQLNWSAPTGHPVLVRLVQGGVPQSMKFDPQRMQQGIETYMKLAALPPKQAGAEPDIIILPETVMPQFQNRYPPQVWQDWKNIARERNATLVMGIPIMSDTENGTRYTNSVIALTAETPVQDLITGTTRHRYDKHHLVPFGEFIPPGFRWFVDALNIPLGDFNRGSTRQSLFALKGQIIAPNICYEDVFGEEIIPALHDSEQYGPGATLLVNVSNLAWFGDTWALRQHLEIARMRALETGRPMLRATNTGMTAAIDPNGTVRAALLPEQPGVLDVEVQGMQGFTPYARWGNTPLLALSLLLLAVGVFAGRQTGTK